MMKEILQRTTFKYKLSIVVLISLTVVILTVRYIYLSSDSFSQTSFFVQDPLSEVFSNEPLDIIYVEDNLQSLDQKDLQLIQYARVRYLTPPSKLPYNLDERESYQDAISTWVSIFFKNKEEGTFVETGVSKGGDWSRSLFLEKDLAWTGLLVECYPMTTPYLRAKHRKSWIVTACLSPTTNPVTLNVSTSYPGTPQPPSLEGETNPPFYDVEAIPLYTILAALGWKDVDLFSFDVELVGLSVLRVFPFELVKFKVLLVVDNTGVNANSLENKVELNRLLISKGYLFVQDFPGSKIYVHETCKDMLLKS